MSEFGRHYVTHYDFRIAIESLEERLEQVEASQAQNQASIDAETAKTDQITQKLVTVQAEVDALKAAQSSGQALDFSKLDVALAGVSAQADTDVADAAPAQPAPEPVPAPEPAPGNAPPADQPPAA